MFFITKIVLYKKVLLSMFTYNVLEIVLTTAAPAFTKMWYFIVVISFINHDIVKRLNPAYTED